MLRGTNIPVGHEGADVETLDRFRWILTYPERRPVLVHYSSIEGTGFRSLGEGERVSYEPAYGRKGEEAQNVRKVE